MGARCQVCEGDVRPSCAGRRGQGPRGVGDVSKDSLKCMGDVNQKGRGVRRAWTAGEGLKPGCSSPQGAVDVECGVRGGSLTSSCPRDATVMPRLVRPSPRDP